MNPFVNPLVNTSQPLLLTLFLRGLRRKLFTHPVDAAAQLNLRRLT